MDNTMHKMGIIDLEQVITAVAFCCPNCGSSFIASFESLEGEYDHGLYHVWHREECVNCQTTFKTILHPVWIEDIDVPKTPQEPAERRKKHIEAGLCPSMPVLEHY